jgi:hypothetical protein
MGTISAQLRGRGGAGCGALNRQELQDDTLDGLSYKCMNLCRGLCSTRIKSLSPVWLVNLETAAAGSIVTPADCHLCQQFSGVNTCVSVAKCQIYVTATRLYFGQPKISGTDLLRYRSFPFRKESNCMLVGVECPCAHHDMHVISLGVSDFHRSASHFQMGQS